MAGRSSPLRPEFRRFRYFPPLPGLRLALCGGPVGTVFRDTSPTRGPCAPITLVGYDCYGHR